MTNTEIAETIKSQLGNLCLRMIGTKRLTVIDRGIQINHSCRGSKTNIIQIQLNGLDLYDIKFLKTWGAKIKTIANVEDVYCDQVHEMIEKHTGLYTNF